MSTMIQLSIFMSISTSYILCGASQPSLAYPVHSATAAASTTPRVLATFARACLYRELLLDGLPAFNTPGILALFKKDICDPIRELIEREGIAMVEKTL